MNASPVQKKVTVSKQRLKLTILFFLGVLISSLAIILLFPSFSADPTELGVSIPGSDNVTNFYEYISAIINFAIDKLGPIIAVMMIMYGGYLYVMSEGDSTRKTTAKSYIWGAIYGYGMLFLTKLIINVLGVNV